MKKNILISFTICIFFILIIISNKIINFSRYCIIKNKGECYLIDYLKDFPKGGDLHIHLAGAIPAKEWLRKAEQHQLYYMPATFAISNERQEGYLPISHLKHDFAWESFYSKLTLRSEKEFPKGHDHFFESFKMIRQIMKYVPLEEFFPIVLQEAKANHVSYLEIMVGAHLYPSLPHKNFSFEEINQATETLQPAIDQFIYQVQQFLDRCDDYGREAIQSKHSIFSTESPVSVRFIIEISRDTDDLHKFFYRALAAFKLIEADPRVRSINIVGTEDAPMGIDFFNKQMKIVNDLSLHFSRPIALHSGEFSLACGMGSYLLTNRISSSLNQVQKIQRLGHATSFPWDLNSLLAQEIIDRNITIEVCPSSSKDILNLEGCSHPIHLFLKNKIPIVIATDDAGISNTSLTNEYVQIAKWVPNLTYKDLKNIAIQSLESSFLRGEGIYDKNDNGYFLKPMFQTLNNLSEEAIQLLQSSEKARIEYQHALKIANFEKAKEKRSDSIFECLLN